MSDNKYTFYPYLRKGLNSHITQTDSLGGSVDGDSGARSSVRITVTMDAVDGEGQTSQKTYEKVLELYGPGDVSGISETAVMQTVPSEGDKGYCSDYLAAIEFFEEDLPWRYTPLAPNGGCLRPWLSLILCKDDEFTEETAGSGMKVVRLNLNEENYSQVLPDPSDCHLYAHVQLIGRPSDVNEFLEKDPDSGISRIFCPRKIEGGPLESEHIHYTAFLIPSFELGRRRGLGQGIDGIDIQKHAWPGLFQDANPDDLVFPVYYQWSFTSGGDKFSDLANKLRPVTPEENAGFSPFITADINDCGLGAYKVDAEKEPEKLMDPIGVPVACVKLGFDEDEVEKNNSESFEMRKWMKEKLLDKSPVFGENRLALENGEELVDMDEDPWVVPPIYGAKQALSTEIGWDASKRPKDWVSEQNLTFRHRIAGGLGKKVVQDNQEDFVQRAWLQVEQINALNQTMRERLSGVKLDRSARKQFDEKHEQTRKNNKKSPARSGFSTDSFIKTLHLSHQPELNAREVIDKHLALVQSYAKGDYRNAAAVSEDFIEALLKNKDSDSEILKSYFAHIIAANPVIMTAAGAGSSYRTASPAAALMYDMFDVRFNGLTIDIKNGTFSYVDGKTPFEFVSKSGEIKKAYDSNKLDNQTYQVLLAWLSGFDNYPGDKDYYDDDCDFRKFRLWMDQYNAEHIYDPDYYKAEEKKPGSYNLADNILPYKVLIKGSDEKGFALPDPTYRRFFGSMIDGETNAHGIGIEYIAGTSKKASKKIVYFFPASSAKEYATWKLAPHGTLNVNKEGRHSDGDVALGENYYIGELSDSIVSGSVSKSYDFRQGWEGTDLKVETGDHCFVLPPDSLGREYHTRFFSRYGTIYQLINELEDATINGVEVFKVPVTWEYKDKKTGRKCKFSGKYDLNNGWMRLTTSHKFTTLDGKSYDTHKVTFHNCLISRMIYKDGKRYYFDFSKVIAELKALKKSIETFADGLYFPDVCEFDMQKFTGIKTYDAWTLIDGESRIEKLKEQRAGLWTRLQSERKFWDAMDKVPPEADPDIVQTEAKDQPLIDPSKEAMDKLTSILERYYSSGKLVDIDELLRSKHPVMAHPEYPDPTYFYLRELSERFILPSAGELPANSISLFLSNAKFEEAFLSGMNTEMGHELLWREYPTDERGSYFRKFWDSEEDPASDSYWDVERMEKWEGRLGQNHSAGKGSLLIFAIKGELLQCYPQTFVYLTLNPAERDTGSTVIFPAMTSWLSGDTFIAGFRASDLEGSDDTERIKTLRDKGYYLTLQERDSSMHFDHEANSASSDQGSAGWASTRLHQPMVWAMPCKYAVNL